MSVKITSYNPERFYKMTTFWSIIHSRITVIAFLHLNRFNNVNDNVVSVCLVPTKISVKDPNKIHRDC